MNILDIHSKITGDYASHIRSFIRIAEANIREAVNRSRSP